MKIKNQKFLLTQNFTKMKNHLLLLSLSLFVLFATSCIDNDESEGVKQIRLGQAALLQAQAQTEITLANSQAAIDAAKAALKQAEADYEKARIKAIEEQTRHEAAMNAIEEELAAATSEAAKAAIQQRIDEAAARHEVEMAALEADKIGAEMNLLETQRAYDQAQKDYEEAMAQAEIDHQRAMAQIAADAKSQEMTDLINGYEAAYSRWSNQNLAINNIKHHIADLERSLNNQQIADSSAIKSAKQSLEFAEENVVNLESDLDEAKAAVRNTDAIDEIIEGYNAEKETLEATLQSQKIQFGISQNLYNTAWDRYNEKYDNYTGKWNDFSTIDTDLRSAESDTLNAYNNYFVATVWSHSKAGSFIDNVTYEKAVETEEGDAVAGVYPTLNDQADVERAKAAAAEAKALYDKAIADYNTLYGKWLPAQQATIAAQKEMAEAWATVSEADEALIFADNQVRATGNRINTVENYISQLTSYTDILGNQLVEILESQLEWAKQDVEYYESAYKAAIMAYEADKPMREIFYEGFALQISNLQERLIAEEAKLELYKAELDDWNARLQAALEEEN